MAPVKHFQPLGLTPGIYFNLDEKKYHADPALSHGGMVSMLIHPLEYWHNSPLNPHKEFKESPAMTFGKRCHKLLLEPKEFFKEFAVLGGKEINSKKTYLTRNEFKDIEESVNIIKKVPEAYDYFSMGYPEVTIVWRDPETDIMLRIRVDWLRIFGGIDYKRARNIENNPLGWHIAEFGYDIQDVLYREGISQIKRLLRAGKAGIFGEHDKEWMKEFLADNSALFCFFFQRSTRPYIFRIMTLDNEIRDLAKTRVRDAIHSYKHHIEKYGTAEWPAGKPQPEEFSFYHLPRRIMDQGVS